MKNIYFIEPKSRFNHIFSFAKLPRIGTIILATILNLLGYNTKVFIEDISGPIEKLPRRIWKDLISADLICITSITSTANRAFRIADMFKGIGIPIAMGGPHSTFLPEESMEHADYVIRGEGEETLVELIEYLESGKSVNTIKGLSFKNSKRKVINNPHRDFIKNLDGAPIPDFNLVYKWMEKAKVVPIATSRGCPFACKFCSVIPMFGRQYRFKSINRIIREIKDAAKYGKRHIFFIDDNFTANKNRIKVLLKILIKKNIKITWSAQVRADIAKDPELLELMEKTGCFAVFIGFESINQKTLSLYNKGQGVKDVENAIAAAKKYNINIHGMFVLGSDSDDIETIKDTAKFAIKYNLESIQFMALTPLPGTPLFEELKKSGRLIHTDWSKYDAHHAVFRPKLMTASELHIETLKAMGEFYTLSAAFRSFREKNYYYAAVNLYGKWSVLKARFRAIWYVKSIKEN